jgi:hypothetical protein
MLPIIIIVCCGLLKWGRSLWSSDPIVTDTMYCHRDFLVCWDLNCLCRSVITSLCVTSEYCCYCYSDLNNNLDVSAPRVQYTTLKQMKQDDCEYVQVILDYGYKWAEHLLRVNDTGIFKLAVRGSVHHSIIYKENPTRCNSVSKFLSHIYMKLNMFRATHRPSSGAKNCTSSLWFCIRGGLLDV